MSTTVGRFLDVARSQLGTVETPVNRTKYGSWYGLDGNAWCAMFVSWVADQCGALDVIPRHAYTPSGAAWFRSRGRLDMSPRPGDLVFFQWAGVGRICHVGIVEAVRPDGRIVTIEGNAQPGTAGDQSNGGGVYRRVRSATAYVKGYGHPQFASESANAAELKAHPSAGAGLAVDGEWGPLTTKALQRFLGVPADGDLGPVTARALQRYLGANADGIIGPQTRKALQRHLGVKADGAWGPQTTRALQARLNGGVL